MLPVGNRRRTLILLLLILVLDYGDRALIGAMGPTLKAAFHIGNARLGLLATAVNITGALASLPAGMLVDHVNRTRLLAAAVAVWSGAMTLVGFATSYIMLVGFRLLLGAVTATSGPATPSLVGDLVPASRRAQAMGFVVSGQLVGIGLGFVLAAFVTAVLTFRWGFWLLAVAGAGVAAGFWLVPEPRRKGPSGARSDRSQGRGILQRLVARRGIQPSHSALLPAGDRNLSFWDVVAYVVRVPTDVIALIARSVGDFFLAAISTFAVVYATGQFGISQQFADLAILVLGVGAVAGVILVGRVSDALLRRGHLNARLWLGAAGYMAAALILLPVFLTHSIWVALPLIVVAAFFLAGAISPVDAIRVDVLAPRTRGRAEAIREVLRTLAEGGAPALFGFLSGILAGGGTSGLQAAFLLSLPALFLNGVILLFALPFYGPDIAAVLVSSKGSGERS